MLFFLALALALLIGVSKELILSLFIIIKYRLVRIRLGGKPLFEGVFRDAVKSQEDQRVESGHGRREVRQVWVLPVNQLGGLYQQDQWAGLQSVVMVYRRRRLDNGQVTEETQFFLSSLDADAQRLGRAIRLHWGIENQLHWVLDVTFGEDNSRIRQGHGPENFTLLKRMAISALNQETSSKRSIRQKAKLASMRPDYMMKVLASATTR